jgi:hypothetical protein
MRGDTPSPPIDTLKMSIDGLEISLDVPHDGENLSPPIDTYRPPKGDYDHYRREIMEIPYRGLYLKWPIVHL